MFDYSVVIPAHNEEAGLGRAIESVLAQSVPATQIIVVDDGSTDGTSQVAGKYGGVHVVRHDVCRGLAQARNTGIAHAMSTWVAFLDSDDWWDEDKIEKQATLATATGAGLIYTGMRRVQRAGDHRAEPCPARVFRNHRALCRKLLLSNYITGSASTVVVRRELLEKVGGFDNTLVVAEDWDLWMRLSQYTTFTAVREPLVTLLVRSGSLGGNPQRMFEGEKVVLAKNKGMYACYWDGKLLWRHAQARLYERLGKGYLMKRQRKDARNCFVRAAVLWPFRLHILVPLAKLLVGAI